MRRNRRGFTLVEVLTVVTVVAILAAVLLQAVGGAVEAARRSATESMLYRLQGLERHRAEALQRLQTRSPAVVDGSTEMELLTRQGSPYRSLDVNARRVLARKLMLAHWLPQQQSEAWDANFYPPGQDAVLAALTTNNPDSRADDDARLVDAWGRPVVFLRWPTRLFAAHPELLPGRGVYVRDPDDPLCSLKGLFAPGKPFDAALMPVLMPDPCLAYVSTFASAGPDGRLGFSLPLGDVTSEDELSDDIFSHLVR